MLRVTREAPRHPSEVFVDPTMLRKKEDFKKLIYDMVTCSHRSGSQSPIRSRSNRQYMNLSKRVAISLGLVLM